jgi:hypothetical protein
MSDDALDVERLARGSLRFRKRVIELGGDEELRVDDERWRDAIVFLQRGEVELECSAGVRRRFAAGAVLCLLPPVRVVRNRAGEPARMIAISRRTKGSG